MFSRHSMPMRTIITSVLVKKHGYSYIDYVMTSLVIWYLLHSHRFCFWKWKWQLKMIGIPRELIDRHGSALRILGLRTWKWHISYSTQSQIYDIELLKMSILWTIAGELWVLGSRFPLLVVFLFSCYNLVPTGTVS